MVHFRSDEASVLLLLTPVKVTHVLSTASLRTKTQLTEGKVNLERFMVFRLTAPWTESSLDRDLLCCWSHCGSLQRRLSLKHTNYWQVPCLESLWGSLEFDGASERDQVWKHPVASRFSCGGLHPSGGRSIFIIILVVFSQRTSNTPPGGDHGLLIIHTVKIHSLWNKRQCLSVLLKIRISNRVFFIHL